MYESTLNLSPPAFLTLTSASGTTPARIDVYEARRALEDANRKPSEAQKWAAVLDYIAGKLSVPRESLAESTALEFNDAIVRLVGKLNEERQKKTEQTAARYPVPRNPQRLPNLARRGKRIVDRWRS
jgi:hypothetical protein